MRKRNILLVSTALIVGLVAVITQRGVNVVAQAGDDFPATQFLNQNRSTEFVVERIVPAKSEPDGKGSDYGWGPVRQTDW